MRAKLVVLAVLALVTVACADAPTGARSDPSDSGIVHPSGADQVVLRVALEGGFVAPETTFARMPSFSLMGDGTIIEPGAQDEIYPGQALPQLLVRTISEDGIQAILGAAIDAGLDHDGTLGDLGSVGVSDMPTTVFTLSANGETHRVEAYALGMPGTSARRACPKGRGRRGRSCRPSWSSSAGYPRGCPRDRSPPRLPTTPRAQRCSSARTEGIPASARIPSRGRSEPG